jgi:GNAT superfamily N-acetyltransferase
MGPGDALAVHELAERTFADLGDRMHEPVPPPRPPGPALVRHEHQLARDPDGAWVADAGGEVVGAALAIERDGLWGLSLLVVDPRHQSGGLGRALLARALEYGGGGRRGGIILASPDPRALRAYARAGFTPQPSLTAHGSPTGAAAPPAVREGGLEDLGLTERADGGVRLLAALDDEAAADLLRAALASVPPGEATRVDWLTAGQGWAIGPVLDARLELRGGGAVFVRGEVGVLRPYLPSGAYL